MKSLIDVSLSGREFPRWPAASLKEFERWRQRLPAQTRRRRRRLRLKWLSWSRQSNGKRKKRKRKEYTPFAAEEVGFRDTVVVTPSTDGRSPSWGGGTSSDFFQTHVTVTEDLGFFCCPLWTPHRGSASSQRFFCTNRGCKLPPGPNLKSSTQEPFILSRVKR